jgi:hypothetical protein
MITAEEYIKWRWTNPEYNPGIDRVVQWLQDYALGVVDECAGNFECTMEDDMDYVGSNSEGRDQYVKIGEHPVLVRASVLAVKEKIK